jgi:hypothetical protein
MIGEFQSMIASWSTGVDQSRSVTLDHCDVVALL